MITEDVGRQPSWPSTDCNGIPLADPVSVTVQGNVVLFARQAGVPVDLLYYNVRPADAGSGEWTGWRQVAMAEPARKTTPDTPSADAQPMLRLGGGSLITVSPEVAAPAPADAPFRVIADDRYVACFRQSDTGTLYVDRFVLVQEPLDTMQDRAGDGPVFVLRRVWETRYRRSEVRDMPAGPGDALGATNMLDQPFQEPTVELTVSGVTEGAFDVALVPTGGSGMRWHIAAVTGKQVTCWSFPQDSAGRVDMSPRSAQSFTITPAVSAAALRPFAGVALSCYEEQERTSMPDGTDGTLRRTVRFAITMPVRNEHIGLPSALAVYDFAVQPGGTIPPLPDPTPCVLIDGRLHDNTFTPAVNQDGYVIPAEAVHTVEATTVTAVLLGQPAPSAAPTLLNSADGLLHCYFAGAAGRDGEAPFLVAQMDPVVTRATAAVPWTTASRRTGDLQFVARQPGTTLNGLTVRVEDCDGHPDLCTVTVDYGSAAGLPTETWRGVPRDIVLMATILNGGSSDDAADPAVLSGKAPFYDVTGTLTMARLETVNDTTPGPLTLVSHRGDVRLDHVYVAAAPDPTRWNLVLSYALPEGTRVTQTWLSVPAAVTDLVAVLDGDASASTYPYQRHDGDTPIYALATDQGTILVFAKAVTPVTLSVRTATNGSPTYCDIVVQQKGSPEITLPNVHRNQAGVVAALRGSTAVAALLTHISADSCPGDVLDQSTSEPLDLRAGSTLFDVVRPTPAGGTLVPGSTAVTVLQGRSFDAPPPDGMDTERGMLGVTAARSTEPLLGEQATVDDSTSTLTTAGGNGRWLSAHVPEALSFNQKNAVAIPSPSARLTPSRGTTIETWARPTDGTPSRMITYNNGPATRPGGITPSYFLGTVGMSTVRFDPFTPKAPYDGRHVNVPAQSFFAPAANAGFTWEAWIRPDARPGPAAKGRFGCVFQVQDNELPGLAQCQLYLDAERVLTFGYRTGSPGNPRQSTLVAHDPLPGDDWTHVAVTGARAPGQNDGMTPYTLTLFVNGERVAADDTARLYPAGEAPFVCLGASDIANVSLFGSIAETRYWSAARTSAELRRTMNTSLQGTEPGLVGYWPLTEDPTTSTTFANRAARYGAQLNGTMTGSGQPVSGFDAGEFVNLVAGVGGAQPLLARSFMRAEHWHHLAVVYGAAGGLRMNPDGLDGRRDYGRCDASGVEFGEHATVEAWIQVPKPASTNQTVLAQWGDTQSDQAFRFGVTDKGTASCAVTLNDPTSGALSSLRAEHPALVCDGKPHHITAVFATQQSTVGPLGVTARLTVYVDGDAGPQEKIDFTTSMQVMVVTSDAPLTLGISTLPGRSGETIALEAQEPFQGVLTGVRFSSVAFTAAQVRAAMNTTRDYDGGEAMVSAWWFDEQTGSSAADSLSDNDFALSDTDMWSTFASISTMDFYCDGVLIGLVSAAPDKAAAGYQGTTQCTIGGYLENSSVKLGCAGQLAEVRVWQATRTHDQLRDTMYRPLSGSEAGLSAYWPLDGDYTDRTGLSGTGKPVGDKPPAFMPSQAPVGNEGPQVRNAYAGTVTAFQRSLTGRPSVLEHAASEIRSDGTPAAVMRRAYFLCDPAIAEFTGYGLGELLLTYLGQVQTSPSLIGYIEGPPPVPSENLTRPLYLSPSGYNSYFDAATVQLAQTETTSFSFTSSDYRTSVTMSVDAKLGVGMKWEDDTQFGIPGGFYAELAAGKLKLTAHNKSSLSQAQQHDEAYVSAWLRTTTDTMGLRGAWETGDYVNTGVGRRYLPHNTGYALVESLTADLYAMRLRSTGAMVGKIVLPDLEIPPDRNVLVFRIRPEYVKNGTLDGKVGLVNDPHYPQADVDRGSYFKPREAYRLAARIAKADTDLTTYFSQLNSQSIGAQGPGSPSLTDQAAHQFHDFDTEVPARGIANRYVWTAAGGLHNETESFSATHDNTYTGLFSSSHGTGLAFESEFSAVSGPVTSIDLLFGGEVKVQVGKKRSDTRGVSLNVTNVCDPMLQAYDPKTSSYSDAPCPGKVDAYRFMSFYLPPSADNHLTFLSTVVDQEWLRFSGDPNAVALRGLKPQAGGAWRVLHRVTYVSRVPPKFDTNPAQTVAPAPEPVTDVDDNTLLVELVERALGKNPPTGANVGAAVVAVLAPTDGTPSLLGDLVPWWAAFVRRTRSARPDPVDVALLNRLVATAVTYFQAGYAGGALPI
jgi:hypothetical protein